MVSVHLVTGFLGAGKTTVLRTLLRALPPDERVAVVVNDFGEASVDAVLLEGDGRGLREIRGACVCCTAPEGFVAAVGELVDPFDRILVEPTGLARPVDLIDTLRRAPYASRLSIGPLIVVLDPQLLYAGRIPTDLLEQTAWADVLIANRVDQATPEALASFRAWAAALWPGPLRVLETERGQVDADVLHWPPGTGPRTADPIRPAHPHEHEHDHDHDHDLAFSSRTLVFAPDVVFHRERLLAALTVSGLARAKGLFRTDEGYLVLQLAGGTVEVTPSGWRRDSRVDLIVERSGERSLDDVIVAIGAARLSAEESARSGTWVELVSPKGSRLFDRAALAALAHPVDDVSALVPGRVGVGARVAELFAAAGAPAEGEVVVVAKDGFASPAVPVSHLANAVLLHSVGDAPLTDTQGGPFRLLRPGGTDACSNVKGVVRLVIR